MNKIKRIALAGSMSLLANYTPTSLASSSDTLSACTSYLGWSSSTFLSKVSSSESTANTVASTLTACLHENDCTSIEDSISDCDTLLGNRLYTASFYASKFALGGASSVPSTTSTSTANSSAAPRTRPQPAAKSSNAPTSNLNDSSSSTSSTINW